MSSSEDANADAAPAPQDTLPLRMISKVVRGFGRGSSDLGIPTANLDLDQLQLRLVGGNEEDRSSEDPNSSLQRVPCGIYWGYCRVGEPASSSSSSSTTNGSSNNATNVPSPLGKLFVAAISIGYNPTYGNEQKTVEPHLIAPEGDPRRHASSSGETVLQDFYDEPIRLSVVGYLRPELPFEGLDKLVTAIKKDIVHTVTLAQTKEGGSNAEKAWVESNEKA